MNDLIPVNDIQTMAAAVAKSGLFGMKTTEQAFALMLLAQAEGRHPATVARDYDIIQGRPAKRTEAMLRDFIEAGGKVEWHRLDDTIAEATFSHAAGGTVRISWDMKRAAVAGLNGKDTWKKYPRQMLRNRVVSEGIRSVCPAATSGMYEPGEVQDMTPKQEEKVINPVANALGDWGQEHPEQLTALQELAAEVVDLVEAQKEPRIAFLRIEDQNLDQEQKLALWGILAPNSKTRTALKKEAEKARIEEAHLNELAQPEAS